MEILSDATFRGNVSINGGNFSVTRPGESSPIIQTNNGEYELYIDGSEFVRDDLTVYGQLHVHNCLNLVGTPISSWTDLNDILNFAPSSLSTTVNSHTNRINWACSTISSLCSKVDSLCSTVLYISKKYALGNPTLPVGCTKFYFVDNYHNSKPEFYRFVTEASYLNNPSTTRVFKGGRNGPNEEVRMDIKQYLDACSRVRWFEATLASNTTGYNATEFIIVFDEFGRMSTSYVVPQ